MLGFERKPYQPQKRCRLPNKFCRKFENWSIRSKVGQDKHCSVLLPRGQVCTVLHNRLINLTVLPWTVIWPWILFTFFVNTNWKRFSEVKNSNEEIESIRKCVMIRKMWVCIEFKTPTTFITKIITKISNNFINFQFLSYLQHQQQRHYY